VARQELNRVIWILWLQGFEKAPEVVRVCLRSWKTRNPGWQVIELSEENLEDYVDKDTLSRLKSLKIRRPKLANLIRMYLISRHGGVWVDATCLCCQPLDNWIHDYMASGFFAFRDPGPDRVLANWFLASVKGNALASRFFEEHSNYFLNNEFPLQGTKEGTQRVKRAGVLMRKSPIFAQWWTHPLMIRAIKAYPYFIFHYHFARLVRRDPICRDIWERTPRLSALGPLKLGRVGLLSPMTSELREDLQHGRQPLYKLKWHYPKQNFKPGCILDYAMRSVP
jgi:hypothetical protein